MTLTNSSTEVVPLTVTVAGAPVVYYLQPKTTLLVPELKADVSQVSIPSVTPLSVTHEWSDSLYIATDGLSLAYIAILQWSWWEVVQEVFWVACRVYVGFLIIRATASFIGFRAPE